MKRKAMAKIGVSKGSGFSLNGSRAGSAHAGVSVKTARYARAKYYKTNACFSGREGIVCERVWDGKKGVDGGYMAAGESISQEEYITRKRVNGGIGCRDLIFRASNVGDTGLSVVLVNGEYVIELADGKQYSIGWNRDPSVIAAVIANNNAFKITSVMVEGNYEVVIENSATPADILSFRNPVRTEYKPQCINDKLVYVDKGVPIEPLSYDGVGGYLDKVRQPFVDDAFCKKPSSS